MSQERCDDTGTGAVGRSPARDDPADGQKALQTWRTAECATVAAEGAVVATEGASVAAEGATVRSEGATVAAEGATLAAKGAAMNSEGATGLPRATLCAYINYDKPLTHAPHSIVTRSSR